MSEDLNQIYCGRSLDMNSNSVNCYYLLAENTLDEYILAKLESKRVIVNGTMDELSVLDFDFDLLSPNIASS
jgi:SNF2 family DNA or RNA helicase